MVAWKAAQMVVQMAGRWVSKMVVPTGSQKAETKVGNWVAYWACPLAVSMAEKTVGH